jgi:hypothetical protein
MGADPCNYESILIEVLQKYSIKDESELPASALKELVQRFKKVAIIPDEPVKISFLKSIILLI